MKLRQTMLLMGKDSSSISLLFSCCIDASVQIHYVRLMLFLQANSTAFMNKA